MEGQQTNMAINIKNLEEIIQKKAYAVTSSTPSVDLSAMVETSLLATNSIRQYDSAGLLPIASTSNDKIAFVLSDKSIRFNNGTKWGSLASGAAQAGSSGDAAASSAVQGSNFGYSMGAFPVINTIQKWSFTADANATDVADLAVSTGQGQAAHSSENAYYIGGFSTVQTNAIQKHNFAAGTNATDALDAQNPTRYGSASMSSTHGYIAGDGFPSDTISKFPFASDDNATDVGNLTAATQYSGSNASETYGYAHALDGSTGNIEKYSYTSDGNATSVGNLAASSPDGREIIGGMLSDVSGGYGYVNGTYSPYNTTVLIERYAFASDGDGADYSDPFQSVWLAAAAPSTTSGYIAGGTGAPHPSVPSGVKNTIQKFPYSNTTTGTDVGDLVSAIGYNAGAAN